MKKLLEKNNLLKPPKIGDIVEGEVICQKGGALFLDLGPIGTGIIYGKEFNESKEKLKDLKKGEKIFVKIIDLENEDGYVEVSFSGASREMAFEVLKQKKEKKESILVKILGANKGGLISEISGIPAFLPVSQLSPEHYPKVEGGEKSKILKELQKFVGKELEVKILDLDPKNKQIILSEKAKSLDQKRELLKKYKVGDIIEGEVSGLTDFGAFLKFDEEGLEGLIHISELDWKIINHPSEVVKMGDKARAKIIDISGEKVFLSLKALKEDPWEGVEKRYKKGDIVSGKVIKINPFGAFIELTPEIYGLWPISEFKSTKKKNSEVLKEGNSEEILKVGQIYQFQILLVDEKNHRIILKLVEE